MVTLKKIKKTNSLISFEYFPEDMEKDVGTIIYDIEKEAVVEKSYCTTDEDSELKTYFKKAIRAIKKCVEEEELPEKYIYMWY